MSITLRGWTLAAAALVMVVLLIVAAIAAVRYSSPARALPSWADSDALQTSSGSLAAKDLPRERIVQKATSDDSGTVVQRDVQILKSGGVAAAGQSLTLQASCPPDQVAIGGGGGEELPDGVELVQSEPANGGGSMSSWLVTYNNRTKRPQNVFATVLCSAR